MPNSYSTMMGTATSVWFTGSKVGVIMAAATKARTTATRRKRPSQRGVTTPRRASANITMGIWKTTPIQNISDVMTFM